YALMNDKVYSVGCVMKNFKRYPYFIEHPLYPYALIFDDGSFDIIKGSDFKKVSGSKKKIRSYLQSKPMLVYDNKTPVSLAKSREAAESRNPRTAIAILRDGRTMCVAVEGRREDAVGMTQIALSELLIKLGAVRAINMDGGGSSTIILNGVLMNRTAGGLSPFTPPGEQRPIHSSVLFKIK
ncbi:MAG TPA: phosphodiester glycosidase family protein, partial [Candidatus Wallbacteria bacterium]|nr:phosphodiester glycosidase family protein [Candidatus Wallbacteria bacterium]